MRPEIRGLDAREITFAYKQKTPILKGVNLHFEPGTITALLGNNGCGKTTLLKIIAGITHQNSGDLIFGDNRILATEKMTYKKEVGFMPESLQLYPEMRTDRVLRFFAQLKGVDESTVPGVLDKVGLTPHIKKPVKALSKGLKQRLNLAQAIIGNPKILIFDEPSNGFDCSGVANFYKIIKEKAEEGAIVVITTHLFKELKDNVHKIAVLTSGEIRKFGSVEDFAFEDNVKNKSVWLYLDKQISNQQLDDFKQHYERLSLVKDRMLHGVIMKERIADLICMCREKGLGVNNIRVESALLEETLEEYLQ